MNAKQVFA